MVARRSLRYPGSPGAKQSKNALGRTRSRRHRAVQKHKPKDPFDFSDNSVSSMMGETGEEEELNESFDPPLHSTVIDAEEELPKRPSVFPATHGREEGRSLNLSETEAKGSSSLKSSTKKPRKLEPISDEFESSEDDVRRKARSIVRTRTQQHQAAPPVELAPQHQAAPPVELAQQHRVAPPVKPAQQHQAAPPVEPAENLAAKKPRPQGPQPSAVVETRAIQRPPLKEDQVLRAVKRKNTQMISNMGKKRQRLIEVQDELLRLEPQLKQLQKKYDDLKERKSSLKNSIHFLSNLKQLYEDYSDVQKKEPKEKEEVSPTQAYCAAEAAAAGIRL
ncbi:hypothetical protein U0070_023274 [Myodes glareolus]|uniref:Centromere protein U n=1 Tax=Myodes glareolus TaxID=447135 RepID=A0AAW0IDK5_MYOGA